jgi:hypothetical protein
VPVTVDSDTTIEVNGELADSDDLFAAASVGDTVTYTAADPSLETDAELALVDATFAGKVDSAATTYTPAVADDVNTPGDESAPSSGTIGIFAADGKTVLGSTSITGAGLGLTGTPTYSVNNTTVDEATFGSRLNAIKDGTLTGTISIAKAGDNVAFKLTTAVA